MDNNNIYLHVALGDRKVDMRRCNSNNNNILFTVHSRRRNNIMYQKLIVTLNECVPRGTLYPRVLPDSHIVFCSKIAYLFSFKYRHRHNYCCYYIRQLCAIYPLKWARDFGRLRPVRGRNVNTKCSTYT